VNALKRIQETLLMGPGPSCVPPAVYDALALPTIGHLDPRFIVVMDEIKPTLLTAVGLHVPAHMTGAAPTPARNPCKSDAIV